MPNPWDKFVSTSSSELVGHQKWLRLSNLLHHFSLFSLVPPPHITENLINRGALFLKKMTS